MNKTLKLIFYTLGVILLGIILYWGYMQLPSRDSAAEVINQQRIEELKVEHAKILAERDAAMVLLNKELEVYKTRDTLLRKEIDDLKRKKTTIKEPGTYQETIQSFQALGYHPY